MAHRLSTISLADRVVLLDGGQIVADGTHAELLASTPLYSEILAQAAAVERTKRQSEDDSDLESDVPVTGRSLMFGGGRRPSAVVALRGRPSRGSPSVAFPHELQAGVDLLLAAGARPGRVARSRSPNSRRPTRSDD